MLDVFFNKINFCVIMQKYYKELKRGKGGGVKWKGKNVHIIIDASVSDRIFYDSLLLSTLF